MNVGQMIGVFGFGLCLGCNIQPMLSHSNPVLFLSLFAGMGICGLWTVYWTNP